MEFVLVGGGGVLRRWTLRCWALGCGLVAATACDGNGGGVYADFDGPAPGAPQPEAGSPLVPPGASVGASCGPVVACRAGLTCTAGTCQPCGCVADGAACVLDDDCSAGSFCGPARTCAPGGSGVLGASCVSDAACGHGLRCTLAGLSAECEPEGTVDIGGTCSTGGSCLGGLGCSGTAADGGGQACEPYPPSTGGASPLGTSTWAGESCSDLPGPTQAYFRVPRGSDDGDFYRLPFPNDVRSTAGTIDFTGYPTPGSALLGYDLVQRWLSDTSATAGGFSTYPTVFFRFSAAVDQNGTLKSKDAIQWVDVTVPSSPVAVGFTWTAATDRNAYICNDWVGVRPELGAPLTPGHTYAVLLSTAILDATSAAIQVPADLTALLASSAPADPALAAQWPKYQPLRDWAAHAGVATSSILDAALFTVGRPNSIGPRLAAAVAAAAPPVANRWIRCGDSPSPCPQATGDRACGTPDPAFDELHALITLPVFQAGMEPYLTAGGDFVLSSEGTPELQRTESVCMSLTVPKGVAMPAGGWPLLVYAHGTGGSFRSAVTDGVAAREASIDNGKGGKVNVAVLGIDQVEHGTRRGSSEDSPANLYYNFANPLAARGNALQGAADQMALVRFASTLDLAASLSPTRAEIKAGPIAFWGHSQGATAGGIAMPYTAGVLGAVLSGEGASIIDALLGKKNPVDIADVLPISIEEDPSKMGTYHPVLALFQNDLDVVDPLNHAHALVAAPLTSGAYKSVFQPFGQGDTYAPPVTEQTFAVAVGLAEVAPPSGVMGSPLAGVPFPAPLGGNDTPMGAILTAVVRQYAPASSYDGDFVAYDNAAAEADVDHFIADAITGQVPKVGR